MTKLTIVAGSPPKENPDAKDQTACGTSLFLNLELVVPEVLRQPLRSICVFLNSKF